MTRAVQSISGISPGMPLQFEDQTAALQLGHFATNSVLGLHVTHVLDGDTRPAACSPRGGASARLRLPKPGDRQAPPPRREVTGRSVVVRPSIRSTRVTCRARTCGFLRFPFAVRVLAFSLRRLCLRTTGQQVYSRARSRAAQAHNEHAARSRACFAPPGFCCLPVSCSGAPKKILWGPKTKTGATCRARGMFWSNEKQRATQGAYTCC
jgi:hypothetical protein